MTKITPDHLARSAFVYVRQSTADQVLHNHESRRRQYALAERARALGWTAVEIIDDDLGRSGSGSPDQASRSCLPRSAKAVSVPSSRLRPRDWLATAGIGIRSWNFVDWSAR
jgi:hypothetical protein